jgi:pentatricopeptide repeat protein
MMNTWSRCPWKHALSLFAVGLWVLVLTGANGCSSDPNIEGAKLDLRNKDYTRALENVEKALQRNPQNADAYELKGRIILDILSNQQNMPLEARRDTIKAMVAAFQKAVELNPKLREEVINQLRFAFVREFQNGVNAFNRGREDSTYFLRAATFFELAALIQPDSAGAYVNQAFSLLNAGRHQESIAPLETAIAKGESSLDAYLILADLHRLQGQPNKAIEILEKARSLYPDNAELQSQLLNAYVQAGRVDEAMAIYGQAVQQEPNNKLYRYNYGSLLLEAGRYDEAIEHLKKAIELDPEYANAYYNLGAAYINKAVDVNEKAIALDDSLRANRSRLSREQQQQLEAQIDQLVQERRALFAEAIVPLERARTLMEAQGENVSGICRALFQAYVQTDQTDKAQAVAACAGLEDNNGN